jgi:hypothetical protein
VRGAAGAPSQQPLAGAHARLKQGYAVSLGGEGFAAAIAAAKEAGFATGTAGGSEAAAAVAHEAGAVGEQRAG